MTSSKNKKNDRTSTVNRGKAVTISEPLDTEHYQDDFVDLRLGNSIDHYSNWPSPDVIISDGAYGILGFEGDTSDHTGMAEWYEPHIAAWARKATAKTTLWFWNTEIGWAVVHPILEKYGFRYVNTNIWNKTKAHIAGNVNTAKIRRYPVVSEVCAHYVFEAKVDGQVLKEWIYKEWNRTGLPRKKANEACGVKDVATRKYLDQGHLWYFPPPEMMEKMANFANKYGNPDGKPYFALNGKTPLSATEWQGMRTPFRCPHGITNIWERPPLKGPERIKANGTSGKAIHLNQKPLDLMEQNIGPSSSEGDIIWEPFGGLFSASFQSRKMKRKSFSCEIDPTYFHFGVKRFIDDDDILTLFDI